MLVSELLEVYNPERHAEREWHANVQSAAQAGVYALYTKSGQVIRPELSLAAAKALQVRPDLVKKYGPLFIRKIS